MKNISTVKHILLCILFILFFVQCKNEDIIESKFSEDPTTRINNKISELDNLLKANDWIVSYTPWKTKTGTFNIYMKFNENNEVQAVSDLLYANNPQQLNTSEYDVRLGTTVKLSFITFNPAIHLFTDNGFDDNGFPPIPGFVGYGFGGSNEFLYYGKNETSDILYFRTNKRLDTLYFVKNTSQNPLDLILENRTDLSTLDNKFGEGFPNITIKNVDTDALISESTIRFKSLVINSFEYGRAGDGSEGVKVVVDRYDDFFELNNNKLILSEYKLNVNDKLTNINFDVTDITSQANINSIETLHTEKGNSYKISIQVDKVPLIHSDHKLLIKSRGGYYQFTYYLNDSLIPNQFFSEKFKEILVKMDDANLLIGSYALGRSVGLHMFLDFDSRSLGGRIDQDYFQFKNGLFRADAKQGFSIEDKGDYMVFTDEGFLNNSGLTSFPPFFANQATAGYEDFKNIIFDPNGWYVTRLGTVTGEDNQIWQFVYRNDTSIFFVLYEVIKDI